MRMMSFNLTTPQFLNGTKDVTRRKGWRNLKAGEHFMAVEKGQGLKRGEKVRKLGECVCVSNRREKLDAITEADVRREGFAGMTPHAFVGMFCEHMKCLPDEEISRIEFAKVPA